MNYLLKRPRPFLYWCGVPYLQFRWFLTCEHGAFFVQTSHTFREKATFEDFTIKPTSQGIKEAKLSSLFVLTVEQRAAASTSGLGTKYHLSLSLYYGLIIPSNFFSFLQSTNYHKLFLQVFQKKGTILRKQNKKGPVLWLFLTFSFSHETGRRLTTENMLRHALWKVKENGFVKKQFKLSRCFCSPKNNSQLEKKQFAKSTGGLNR